MRSIAIPESQYISRCPGGNFFSPGDHAVLLHKTSSRKVADYMSDFRSYSFALTAAPGGMGSFPFSNGPSSAPFGAGSAFLPGLPPDLANLIPGRIEPLGTRPPSIPPSGAAVNLDCHAAEFLGVGTRGVSS